MPCLSPVYLSMGTMVLPEVLSVADLPLYEHNSVTWCSVCHRSTLVWAQWFCLKSCLSPVYLCMGTVVLPEALSFAGLPFYGHNAGCVCQSFPLPWSSHRITFLRLASFFCWNFHSRKPWSECYCHKATSVWIQFCFVGDLLLGRCASHACWPWYTLVSRPCKVAPAYSQVGCRPQHCRHLTGGIMLECNGLAANGLPSFYSARRRGQRRHKGICLCHEAF